MIYYVCLLSIDFTVWDSSVGRYSNFNSNLKPLTMNKMFNHQKKERVTPKDFLKTKVLHLLKFLT